MAYFLGDPRFPEKAMRKNRGFKIKFFQDLYRQYSLLEFSRIYDRPIAIAGLERRLQKAYGTRGSFGIFDDGESGGLLHRSLLWQRGDEVKSLKPIEFPMERNIKVPSWSWMAYEGGIDFKGPGFEEADWEASLSTAGSITQPHSARDRPDMVLRATVRRCRVSGQRENKISLQYDITDHAKSDGNQMPHCVIVAKSRRGATDQEKRHYVLVVTATKSTARGTRIYRRVGAGSMLGKFLDLEGPGEEAELW